MHSDPDPEGYFTGYEFKNPNNWKISKKEEKNNNVENDHKVTVSLPF